MKPGELQSGGYGFYYKGYNTAPVAGKDVLSELQTVITPVRQPQRPTTPAISYKEAITSDVYFSNEKWQEVLASHGILVDAEKKTVTIQSSALEADLQYNLTDEELAVFTSNSIKDQPIAKRLETLNGVIKEDFADAVTMDMLNSDKQIDIKLHPEVQADLDQQITRQDEYYRQQDNQQDLQVEREPSLRDNRPKGGVVMDGNYQSLLDHLGSGKDWDLSRKHGGLRILPPFSYTEAGHGEYRGSMEALAGALVVVNIPRQAARVLETAGLDRYVDLI